VFDIGFSELLVIAVVALVVLGPERLPKAARFAGLWVRRARNQWDSVKQELERELQAEEIKRQMQDVRQGMQDTENQLRASGEAIRREAQEAQQQGDDAGAGSTRTGARGSAAAHERLPMPMHRHRRALPRADAGDTPEAGAPPPQSTERQP
jgi:sec-independent protein translocase protein TatB